MDTSDIRLKQGRSVYACVSYSKIHGVSVRVRVRVSTCMGHCDDGSLFGIGQCDDACQGSDPQQLERTDNNPCIASRCPVALGNMSRHFQYLDIRCKTNDHCNTCSCRDAAIRDRSISSRSLKIDTVTREVMRRSLSNCKRSCRLNSSNSVYSLATCITRPCHTIFQTPSMMPVPVPVMSSISVFKSTSARQLLHA